MTYDQDNRLATFNGANVTIDADGNLTYGPLTNNTFGTYTYDARNELTTAGGLSYGYDPAGNRTSLNNGTDTAVYVIDPKTSQLLMRIKAGITNYYVYGVGLLYESDETATSIKTAFYHYDCRGSTVALADINGNPTDLIEYSPYGMMTYRTNAPGITPSDTPFLYNGQFGVQTDPNGLLYMRARYYNPYISRFLNPDPSGFSGGLNFYLFCNGNPISETDPFGLCSGSVSSGFTWLTGSIAWAADQINNTGNTVGGLAGQMLGAGLSFAGDVANSWGLNNLRTTLSGTGDYFTSLGQNQVSAQNPYAQQGYYNPSGTAAITADAAVFALTLGSAGVADAAAQGPSIASQLEELGGGVPSLVPTSKGAPQFVFPNGTVLRFDLQPGQYLPGQGPHINLQFVPGWPDQNIHIPLAQ